MAMIPMEYLEKIPIKSISTAMGNVTIKALGYSDPLAIPAVTGYTAVAVLNADYSDYSAKSSGTFTVFQSGLNAFYVAGLPNATITSLKVRIIYVSDEFFSLSSS